VQDEFPSRLGKINPQDVIYAETTTSRPTRTTRPTPGPLGPVELRDYERDFLRAVARQLLPVQQATFHLWSNDSQEVIAVFQTRDLGWVVVAPDVVPIGQLAVVFSRTADFVILTDSECVAALAVDPASIRSLVEQRRAKHG
jgi:hypothetical protein